ncbi:hypothetical protein ACFLTV_00870 [Chloroflexota bacterium]
MRGERSSVIIERALGPLLCTLPLTSLISYRQGLTGHDLPIPIDYLPMPATPKMQLNFLSPPTEEADLFITCLTKEPYGISFSKDLMQQFSCPGGAWILAFNRQISGDDAITAITSKKTIWVCWLLKTARMGATASHILFSVHPICKKVE